MCTHGLDVRYEGWMPRPPLALAALLFMSGCMGPSAFATGRPSTEQDYRPVGELQHGLALAGPDVGFAAHFDMNVVRQGPLGAAVEAAVTANAGDGIEAVRSALLEASGVWVFVTARPNDVVDTVFVLEGISADALREYAGTLRSNGFLRAEHGVTEYVVGDLQVAHRSPDTVVLGDSRDRSGQQGSVWDWTDWADRLRGVSRAEQEPELTTTRDALGAADSPIWAAWRWSPELSTSLWGGLAGPTTPEHEASLSRAAGLGFAALPVDDGFTVRAVARASDPDHAAALAAALPSAVPAFARFAPGPAIQIDGPNAYATFTITPEALTGLLAATTARARVVP